MKRHLLYLLFCGVLLLSACKYTSPLVVQYKMTIKNNTNYDVSFVASAGGSLYAPGYNIKEIYIPSKSDWSYSWTIEDDMPLWVYVPNSVVIVIENNKYLLTKSMLIDDKPCDLSSYQIQIEADGSGKISRSFIFYEIKDCFIESLKSIEL